MSRRREDIETSRVLDSEWDTLEDLRPILRDALLAAFEAGKRAGSPVIRQQVTKIVEARAPAPLECTAPYLHQAELTPKQKHRWADIVLRSAEALKWNRRFFMDRADQDAVLAVEALLHRCLPKPGRAEPERERA